MVDQWQPFPGKDPLELVYEVPRAMIPWNNMTNKLIYNEILDLMNDEFNVIVSTALLGAVALTAGLKTLMEDRLNNSSNVHNTRIAWMNFIEVMQEEFDEVALAGWGYAPLTNLRQVLRQTMVDVPNVTHRIAVYNVIDLYVTTFYGLSLEDERGLD